MKKILICIQFLLLTTVAYATGQDSDVIYINGTRWALLDRPVCRDSLLYHHLKAVLPAESHITTANWDGFTSYWSIEEDVFYLDSIRCEHYDINSRKIQEFCRRRAYCGQLADGRHSCGYGENDLLSAHGV